MQDFIYIAKTVDSFLVSYPISRDFQYHWSHIGSFLYKKTPILKTNEECVTFSSDHLPVCITSMPYINTFPNQQFVVILCRAAFCGSTLKTDRCVTVYFVNCTFSLNFVNLPILQQLCIYEHKHIIVINICIPKCVFYF